MNFLPANSAISLLKFTTKVLPKRAVVFPPSHLVVGKHAKEFLQFQHAVGGKATLLPAFLFFRKKFLFSKSTATEHAKVAFVARLALLAPAMLAVGYDEPVGGLFEADAAGRHGKTTKKMY